MKKFKTNEDRLENLKKRSQLIKESFQKEFNKIKRINEDEDSHYEKDSQEMRGASTGFEDPSDRRGNLDNYGLEIYQERPFTANDESVIFANRIYFKSPVTIDGRGLEKGAYYVQIDTDLADEIIKNEELSEQSFIPSKLRIRLNNTMVTWDGFSNFLSNNIGKYKATSEPEDNGGEDRMY